MKPQTYLHIPTPCHEDWSKMTQQEQGRYCNSCCKTVVDFEAMTDQQVLNFFNKTQDNVCGRFSNDQLNRPLQETVIEKKKGWQWLMASVASMFLMVNRASAQGGVVASKQQAQPSKAKKTVIKKHVVSVTQGETSVREVYVKEEIPVVAAPMGVPEVELLEKPRMLVGDTISIAPPKPQLIGSVTDEKGNPIAGVAVTAVSKKGTVMASTNDEGIYFTNNIIQPNEEIQLKFTSLGYEDKTVPLTFDESKLELHVQLKAEPKKLDEVVVMSYSSIRKGKVFTGGSVARVTCTKVKPVDTIKTIARKMFNVEAFKIFPNPASKGKAVNLTINEAGDYAVQLLDNNSRLITVQNMSVSNKQEVKLFNIPSSVQSGIYYIRLVNEKNKKQYVDKLLVQ